MQPLPRVLSFICHFFRQKIQKLLCCTGQRILMVHRLNLKVSIFSQRNNPNHAVRGRQKVIETGTFPDTDAVCLIQPENRPRRQAVADENALPESRLRDWSDIPSPAIYSAKHRAAIGKYIE